MIAGLVAGGLYAPMMLASASAKAGTNRLIVNDTGLLFHPWQAFWFFGTPGHWTAAMSSWIYDNRFVARMRRSSIHVPTSWRLPLARLFS